MLIYPEHTTIQSPIPKTERMDLSMIFASKLSIVASLRPIKIYDNFYVSMEMKLD